MLFLKLKKQKFTQFPASTTLAVTLNGNPPVNLTFDNSDFMLDYVLSKNFNINFIPSTGSLDLEISRPNMKSTPPPPQPNLLWQTDSNSKPITDSKGNCTLYSDAIEDLAIVCYYTATPKDMPKYFGG